MKPFRAILLLFPCSLSRLATPLKPFMDNLFFDTFFLPFPCVLSGIIGKILR